MKKSCIAKVIATIAVLCCVAMPVMAGNAAYDKAVADYTAGKYGQAATEFESLKATYPSNALTRYYLALTRQALGHYDKAKAEYQWVSTNGDARLRAMALQGMQRMSNTKSSVSSSSASIPFGTSSPSSTAAAQSNSHAGAKVKTILKFTAPWCGPCQAFKPIFETVKGKFNDISFEEVDFDSSPDLRAKYGVSAIPHLVFLDSGGKVLMSKVGAPRSVESFERLVSSYH